MERSHGRGRITQWVKIGYLFEPEFNRSVKVETSQRRITSHAGAVLLRELDHKLGLVESLASQLVDPRDPNRIRYTAVELLQERMYALAMGEENQDDLDRPSPRPGSTNGRLGPTGPRRSRRTTSQPADAVAVALAWLAKAPQNREAVRHAAVRLDSSPSAEHAVPEVGPSTAQTVDIDSSAVRVHGEQHGARLQRPRA